MGAPLYSLAAVSWQLALFGGGQDMINYCPRKCSSVKVVDGLVHPLIIFGEFLSCNVDILYRKNNY